MDRFSIIKSKIEDLHIVQRIPIGDNRGYFERMFCTQLFNSFLGSRQVLQINRTYTSRAGSIRGLHFQKPPHAELKIVSCIKGEVFDVAVDLRKGSSTFLRWHSEILTSNNYRTLVIPEGFAHGFQTLTDNCELIYFHTKKHEPISEAGFNALDETLSISWPKLITEQSARDKKLPNITDFEGISL